MSSDTYRVWIRDDWGMDFVAEIPERDAAEVLTMFQGTVCGRSIILH